MFDINCLCKLYNIKKKEHEILLHIKKTRFTLDYLHQCSKDVNRTNSNTITEKPSIKKVFKTEVYELCKTMS